MRIGSSGRERSRVHPLAVWITSNSWRRRCRQRCERWVGSPVVQQSAHIHAPQHACAVPAETTALANHRTWCGSRQSTQPLCRCSGSGGDQLGDRSKSRCSRRLRSWQSDGLIKFDRRLVLDSSRCFGRSGEESRRQKRKISTTNTICDIEENIKPLCATFGLDDYWIKVTTLQSCIHVSDWYFLLYMVRKKPWAVWTNLDSFI